MSAPTYIYKIIPSSSPVPDPLPELLPLSELDATSGFIHLSTSLQVPGTLKHFYAETPEVYICRIRYASVEKDVKWWDPNAEVCGPRGSEGMFPHLYNGGRLGSAEIESSVAVWEQTDGNWEEALKKAESWLVY
ncbi:hypothetical protein B0H17DRAFT_925709 [Mycena rosella]|uniref:DUF952 domain-containing protein n=1 Tax=Mycena rosella TaxID=1033263 RepID=A0AAD7DUV9_MYCRO|nr:hypothetical protein B0H17DRAFT_925709 [Mycena rosella]